MYTNIILGEQRPTMLRHNNMITANNDYNYVSNPKFKLNYRTIIIITIPSDIRCTMYKITNTKCLQAALLI